MTASRRADPIPRRNTGYLVKAGGGMAGLDASLIIAVASLIAASLALAYSLRLARVVYDTALNPSMPLRYISEVQRKPRKRYIVLQLTPIPRDNNSREFVKRHVEGGLRRIVGDTGLVKMGFAFIEYDASSGRIILQVYHSHVEQLLGALGILNNRSEYSLIPLIISGTLRRARRKARR